MDKEKVKIVTLEELKKVDPSHINSMTFTDGSVVMVNSDEEGDNNKPGNISNDLFDKDEKQPDIQNDPNMNINFEDEEIEEEKEEEENGISKLNKNIFINEYIIPSNNNYNKSNYSNLRTNENNLNSKQISNYNFINQKILIPNNKNITQQRNAFIPIQQNKIPNNHSNQIYTNNYNNISIYQSNYSSISSNRSQQGNYQYNNNIRNFQYKPANTEHSHFLRRYYSNQGSNYNNCPYCRFEAKNKY